MPRFLIIVSALTVPSVAAQRVPLVNGDFERAGEHFNIPAGWVPFGDAKYEGAHEGDWHLNLADLHSNQEAGVYQVVPDVVVGARYRLAARARAGHDNLPVQIGLVGGADLNDIAWSDSTTGRQWTTLTTETVARTRQLIVVLEMRNTNTTYQLLEAGAFDDVELTRIGEPSMVELPAPPELHMPSPADVSGSLSNLWSAACPKPGVRTFLAGTHHPDPLNNSDFDRVESTVKIDGETWSVLKSFDGPGCITRFWMTNFATAGRIRIEADDRIQTDQSLLDFYGGPGRWPLAGKNSGAWTSYWPIPFNDSARVLVRGADQPRFYWQITWQRFEPGTVPTPVHDLDRVRYQWACASLDPKPEVRNQRNETIRATLPARTEKVLWSTDQSGMIGAIRMNLPDDRYHALRDLSLVVRCDGANRPQVDVPLDLLFNVPDTRTICRGLMTGNAPAIGGYCYWPMPYRDGVVMAVRNASAAPIDLTVHIGWVGIDDLSNLSPLHFRAHALHDPQAGRGRLLEIADLEGHGHFVGLTAAMQAAGGNNFGYLEGDEYAWVDGEDQPSTAGTGTEDYFSCGWYFSAGPVTLPVYGAPVVDGKTFTVWAYRQHIPDWIPFDESLRFAIEVGDNMKSPLYADYRVLAACYLGSGRN